MNIESSTQISKKDVHHGRNVKRLREILGIKQDALADGINVSQQTVSRLESQEEIDNDMLSKIAKVLKIPVDVIKSYNDDIAVNNITSNTFTFNEQSVAVAYQQNINPIDKIMQLYERLLKSEQDKYSLLEKQLKELQK